MGLFINTLPVVVDLDPAARVDEVLRRIQADHTRVMTHQHVALPELARLAGMPAIFDTLTVHESYPINTESLTVGADADGLRVTGVRASDATHYPLNLSTAPIGDELGLTLKYLPNAFGDTQIEVFAEILTALLEQVAANPDRRVEDLDPLPPARRSDVDVWSTGVVVDDRLELVADAVARAAASNPTAPALIADGKTITYRQFSARVEALADRLAHLGVGPDVAVALCLPRSADMVVAVHAVLAAGGQYVPIDPAAPVDRVDYMLATVDAKIVVASLDSGVATTAAGRGRTVVGVVGDDAPPRPRPRIRPQHAAYTIFTSGSTGRPKGVTVSHGAIANRLAWMQADHPISTADVIMQKTPYTFDVSVWELLWPLIIGARLVVAEADRHGDPDYLADLIDAEQVSVVHFVPSMLATFADVVGQRLASLDSLRLMFTSGEALVPAVAATVLADDHAPELHNLYGPTEAAVDVTAYRVNAGDTAVPIGAPVRNTRAVILDERLRRLPAGLPGELYLGGVQVARGYAGQPRLTAERFVPDPVTGGRLYRTGDLVRWRADGQIEYLGRTDFQVKLRGQRLELGEIEAAVAAVPGVVSAAVDVVGAGADARLVGYLSPGNVDVERVNAVLAAKLPEFMRPTTWVVLDELPAGSSGKVDRKALPAPRRAESTSSAQPITAVERLLVEVFGEVLGVDAGVEESFFALGGNSLSAARVVAALRARHVTVQLPWLFADPTPRGLGRRISADAAVADAVVITLRSDGSRSPLWCVHPAAGLAWFYGGLAPHVTDRPIYGLQDPYVVRGEDRPGSIHAVAARYIDEMRAVQPDGPYNVLGWSIGGVIAQEIAVQLQADGEDVGYVGVLDAPALPIDEPVERDSRQLLGGLRELFNLSGDALDDRRDVVAAVERHIVELGLVGAAQARRIVENLTTVPRGVREHRPLVFDGALQVFTAVAGRDDPTAIARGWEPFAAAVRNVDVDSTHDGLADPAALAVIGAAVQAALER